jgi:hypothetical protein
VQYIIQLAVVVTWDGDCWVQGVICAQMANGPHEVSSGMREDVGHIEDDR